MKALFLLPLLAATLLAQNGFQAIFNGRNLDGWDGDPRFWSVQDGSIIGSTDNAKTEKNTFLIYRAKEPKDFILELDVKLRNHNSGVQFRSEALPNHAVKGLQADMAENNWWGSIYDELGTRGTIVNGWKDKAEKVVKNNDWNHVEIICEGDHVQVKVNGLLTADIHDPSKLQGVIALQLHAGPPMQVAFRNIRLKEIK